MHTDPDRCGLLPFAFEPDFGYERYVEWAVDVPMFFLVRDGAYRPAGGKTFSQVLEHGFEGQPKSFYRTGVGTLAVVEWRSRDGDVGWGEYNWHGDVYELQRIGRPPQ